MKLPKNHNTCLEHLSYLTDTTRQDDHQGTNAFYILSMGHFHVVKTAKTHVTRQDTPSWLVHACVVYASTFACLFGSDGKLHATCSHVLRSFQSNNKFTLIKHEENIHINTCTRTSYNETTYHVQAQDGLDNRDRETGGRTETDGQTCTHRYTNTQTI